MALVVAMSLLYHYLMVAVEGHSHSYFRSTQVVVETFTGTGYGSDSPWDAPLANPFVTVMELWEGIHLADSSGRERAVVKNLLRDLRELPFDRECATTAGEINATLQRDGAPTEDADVMIAATALVHDVPIVTNNADHFDRIDDLELLSY